MKNTCRMSSWATVLSIMFAILIAACNATFPTAQSVGMKQITSGHKEGISTIVFSPDARRVASGGNDNTIKLWDVQTGQLKQTFEGHTRAISSLAFSPGGLILASGSFDRTAKLWDVTSGKLKLTISNHPSGQVKGLSFSPDGKTLAGAGGVTTTETDLSGTWYAVVNDTTGKWDYTMILSRQSAEKWTGTMSVTLDGKSPSTTEVAIESLGGGRISYVWRPGRPNAQRFEGTYTKERINVTGFGGQLLFTRR